MSHSRGTLPDPIAESLASGLEQTTRLVLTELRSGLSGAQASLEGFFGQADQLAGAVQWEREPSEDEWWAVRTDDLIALGSPGGFRLVRSPRSVTCQELSVSREPEGALAVGAGEESWVVRADGVVLSARAVEEGFEQSSERLERGLQKLSEFSGARAPMPGAPSGDWLSELLGEAGPLAARLLEAGPLGARPLEAGPPSAQPAAPVPGQAASTLCPDCRSPLTPGARFCSQCGHKLGSRCPGCQAPTLPEMRYCAQCGQRL